jgi:hypothetical protein
MIRWRLVLILPQSLKVGLAQQRALGKRQREAAAYQGFA